MEEEVQTLEKNKSWDVVDLPYRKESVGCIWVFTVKLHLNGTAESYKARFVAKGYTQTYGVDYEKTFALIAKINFVYILIFVVENHG